jgi:pyruvate dehydrogenase E2 component (dihydrolipoamide acetyltransferase)
METGSISRWNVKEGDKFEAGTSICEVETDKATVSFDAQDEGYLAKILVRSGDIKVGQPIMVTVEEASSIAAFKSYELTDVFAAPAAAAAAAPVPAAAAPAAASTPAASVSAPAAAASYSPAATGSRVVASPFARKLARDAGSSIEAIAAQLAAAGSAGTGPNGRIVASDIHRAAAMPQVASSSSAAAAASLPAAAAAVTAAASATSAAAAAVARSAQQSLASSGISGVFTDFQQSEYALALAARQTHAKQAVPHYYLSVELNLANLLRARSSFNAQMAASKKKGSAVTELSVMDFLVKAAGLAMHQVPDVNGTWMDTFVRRYDQVG